MRTRRNYRKQRSTKKRRGGLFGTLFTSPETKARVAREQAAAVAAAKKRVFQKARDIGTGVATGARAIGTGATRFGNRAIDLGAMGSKATSDAAKRSYVAASDAAKRAYAAAPDAAKKAICSTVNQCIDWNLTIQNLQSSVDSLTERVGELDSINIQNNIDGLSERIDTLYASKANNSDLENLRASVPKQDMMTFEESPEYRDNYGGKSRRRRRNSHRKRGNRRTRK